MKIEKDCVATIHYTLKNAEGVELDSSKGEEPLTYLHGAQNIVSGLEKALLGKVAGDALTAELQPEEAYGPVRPELIQDVPREAFQGVDDISVGQQFQTQGPQDQPELVTVVEVTDETVKINANHPLAGQVLSFDITVEDVRAATKEELEHGHVHSGSCGHNH